MNENKNTGASSQKGLKKFFIKLVSISIAVIIIINLIFNLISEEDKILLYKLYLKLKKEFQNLDKSKL